MGVKNVAVSDANNYAVVADFGGDSVPPTGLLLINDASAGSDVEVIVEGVHWNQVGDADVPAPSEVGMPIAPGTERNPVLIKPGKIRRVFAKGAAGLVSVIEEIK